MGKINLSNLSLIESCNKMLLFVIFVCLPITLPIQGRQLGDDWKTEFQILSHQLEVKENEISSLSSRLNDKENAFDSLQKRVMALEGLEHNLRQNDTINYKFIMMNEEGGYIPSGHIAFGKIQMNNGWAINDGALTVPQDGIYEFLFNGFISNVGGASRDAYLSVFVNGEPKRVFIDNDFSGFDRQVTLYFSMKLQQNDDLYLFNEYSNTYFCDNDQIMTFEGHLSH